MGSENSIHLLWPRKGFLYIDRVRKLVSFPLCLGFCFGREFQILIRHSKSLIRFPNMQLHYSLLYLSYAVLTTALVPFPLEERQIGQACTTPVHTPIHPSSLLPPPSIPPSLIPSYLLSISQKTTLTLHRMAPAHVKTQPPAQPKVSTSQATAPVQLISNAASRKPATQVPAPASA